MTVVLAAEGYPAAPVKGDEILGVDDAAKVEGAYVLHAGTKLDGQGRLLANGGRVLNVVGTGEDVPAARAAAYEAFSKSPSAAATTAPTSPPYDHRRPYDSALAPAQATSATTHRPGPPRSRPKAGSEPARNLIAQRAAGRDEAMRRSRALLAVGGPPGPKEKRNAE